MLSAKTITVERDGSDLDISLPDNFIEKLIENDGSMLFYPRIPAIVSSFLEKSNAEQAGLKVNDQIIGVNDKEIKYNDEMAKALSGLKDSTANILVKRGEEEFTLKSKVSSDGTIGYYPALLSFNQFEEFGVYTLNSDTYILINCFPAGYNKAISKLGGYIDQFKLILNPDSGAYKGVGGFGAIGSLFPSNWNWERFWNLTAFLSLMLAFLNILPIPALDGGHVTFLLYEIVAGKPASEKFMEYAQILGMLILLTLVVYANGNDIIKLF